MTIRELNLNKLTPFSLGQISLLFRQLSPGKSPINLEDLLASSNPIHLIIAEDEGQIIGIASLSIYAVFSGKKGWIEDVVVDQAYRGKGIGKQLIAKLLEIAESRSLQEILLFTEAHRISAIQLYKNLGFKAKATNVYSFKSKK